MRKIFLSILILLLTISLFSIEFTTINEMKYPADLAFKMPDTVEEARCLDVKDGKTIKVRYSGLVEKEKTVELLGVDVSQFESEAKTILEQLIKGENIYLSYDWKATEEGIIKAYVWKHFPNLFGGHNLMINAILLANGYALVDEEEYISADMAAIFFETSYNAIRNKYGNLKNKTGKKPLDFNNLPVEIKKYLYRHYWKTTSLMSNSKDVTSDTGNWVTRTETDKLSGEKRVFISVKSPKGKELTVQYRDAKSKVVIDWDGVLDSRENVDTKIVPISYRFDDGEIIESEAEITSTGIFNIPGDFTTLVNKMTSSSELIVKVKPYDEEEETTSFNLDGLENAINQYEQIFDL